MSCQTKVNIRKRRVCIGDLNIMIQIQNRKLTAPAFNSVTAGENFEDYGEVWAGVETPNGKTFFDGVNTETPVTHIFYLYFDESITAQSWVVLDGTRRIDILSVDPMDEQKEFMALICTERGLISKEASKA